MTDRKQALTELLAKVEAGVKYETMRHTRLCQRAFPKPDDFDGSRKAYSKSAAQQAILVWRNGSLDAAKALFEAVAMDHWRITHMWGDFDKWVVNLTHREGDWENKRRYISVEAQCPARALLIAILSALIAQGDAQ